MRLLLICCWLFFGLCTSASASTPAWPEWEDFVHRFMQADGRVIDITFDGKSTSEGQSYAMFFALVANQPQRFATILQWTDDNLANDQLGEKLPAWLWGRRDNGSWGVKDPNSASDGDLWLAYSLLEAGRLWNAPQYSARGLKLLQQIRAHEIVQVGDASLLLPAPVGFKLSGDRYRLDPSYLPGFIFRYFASVDPKGPWLATWNNYMAMSHQAFAGGVASDIFIVDAHGVVSGDSEKAPLGSYDAIRVYLWAGMSPGVDNAALVKQLASFAALIRKYKLPPEKVDPTSGAATKTDYSPLGYSGAVLPFLSALNERDAVAQQRLRIENELREKARAPVNYYDYALVLFGKGWLDGKYRFDDSGRLVPEWLRK